MTTEPVVIYNLTKRIVYNRVPKTGSRVVEELLSSMSKRHHYTYIQSNSYLDFKPSEIKLQEQISQLQAKKAPWLFDRHIYFFHFPNENSTTEAPLYVNIIRDPIDRCISWYYFIRFEHPRNMSEGRRSKSFDACLEEKLDECTEFYEPPYRCLQIPFICGQDPICVNNSREALQKAKRNVVKKYAVVGLTEDMRSFVRVIEKVVPHFFKRALQVYDKYGAKNQLRYSNSKHKTHSLYSSMKMEKFMSLEIEFYKFVRDYFYRRYKHILGTFN